MQLKWQLPYAVFFNQKNMQKSPNLNKSLCIFSGIFSTSHCSLLCYWSMYAKWNLHYCFTSLLGDYMFTDSYWLASFIQIVQIQFPKWRMSHFLLNLSSTLLKGYCRSLFGHLPLSTAPTPGLCEKWPLIAGAADEWLGIVEDMNNV